MDSISEQFVHFVTETNYEDLSPRSIHSAKRSIVDSIGCALGAFSEQPAIAFRNLATRVQALNRATVIGTHIKTSAEMASITNGTMIRYLDFNDDYFGGKGGTGPHPSDNIGSILAAAESVGGDGKAFILGTVIAYEACGQLAAQVNLGPQSGWDYPVLHAVASALGTAKIFGLSKEQVGDALGMAVVPNICLRETREGEITNWKGVAGPFSSKNGLFAAMMAEQGISGPSQPFEGTAGFIKQLNQEFELEPFGGDGRPFRVEDTYLKAIPVRYTLQLPVWMAWDLRKKIDISTIESIVVHMSRRDAIDRGRHPELWDPHSRETADHSGPYLIGASLVDGQITKETFTASRFRDPTILELVQKITMVENPHYTAIYPGTFGCRFEVTLNNGETLIVEDQNPKGHPANPMSDEEINTKFLQLTSDVISLHQARALLALLWKIEECSDLSEMFPLMEIVSEKAISH